MLCRGLQSLSLRSLRSRPILAARTIFVSFILVVLGACSGGPSQVDAVSSDPAGEDLEPADHSGTEAPAGPRYTLKILSSPFGVHASGSVPDSETRDSFIEAAHDAGYATVLSDLEIDPTLAPGRVLVVVDGALQLGEGDFHRAWLGGWTGGGDVAVEIATEEYRGEPIAVTASFSAGSVALFGLVPDEAARSNLVVRAEQWAGAERVDVTSLDIAALPQDGYRLMHVTGAVDEDQAATIGWLADWASVTQATYWDAALEVRQISRVERAARSIAEGRFLSFQAGSTDLTAASLGALDEFAQIIAEEGLDGRAITIVGHTDSQGDPDTNRELSLNRAQAVKDRLVELGVGSESVAVEGRGDTEPFGDNATADGRALNRRIDLWVR
jgi:outer membrane protein OmpA-like peptidoglycan-associated protein